MSFSGESVNHAEVPLGIPALRCLSIYPAFEYAYKTRVNWRANGSLPGHEPDISPSSPMSEDDMEGFDDPGYIESVVAYSATKNRLRELSASDYEHEFERLLDEIRDGLNELTVAVMARLIEDQVLQVNKPKTKITPNPSIATVDAHNGVRYFYEATDTIDEPSIIYNPHTDKYPLGALEIQVLVPFVCRAALELLDS